MNPAHISTAPLPTSEGGSNGGVPVYESHGMCVCPDARHDDLECPRCRRPSYRPDTIERLRSKR